MKLSERARYAMALSEEVRRSYVEKGGVRCPYCGSRDLTIGSTNMHGLDVVSIRVDCGHCGAQMAETYKLDDVAEEKEGRVSCQVARKHRQDRDY